jgi:uncharacterized membrane protein YfhO
MLALGTERWHEAFMAIQLPPGDHQVVFEFSPVSVRLGAIIALVALAGTDRDGPRQKRQKSESLTLR